MRKHTRPRALACCLPLALLWGCNALTGIDDYRVGQAGGFAASGAAGAGPSGAAGAGGASGSGAGGASGSGAGGASGSGASGASGSGAGGASGSGAGGAAGSGAAGAGQQGCGTFQTGIASCDPCLRAKCCAQLQACGAECAALDNCYAVNHCSSRGAAAGCFEACQQLHPGGVAAQNAVFACSQATCAAECNQSGTCGSLQFAPPACDGCLQVKCCDELDACTGACLTLLQCEVQCADQACLDSCAQLYAAGIGALEALDACYGNSCLGVCPGG
jgi:hypothetical protein